MAGFSGGEAMRDAGSTPAEVCRAALQHDPGLLEAIVVLRSVFQLSLADAKAVVDAEAAARRAADPDRDVMFSVLVIDPRTRAMAQQTMGSGSLERVRELMARPPAIDRSDRISWGNLTRVELEHLAMADCLDCSELEQDMATCPPEQTIWSLFHQTREGR